MARAEHGLDHMVEALSRAGGDRVDRALTLGYVRTLFDPEMPMVAGFDPRLLRRLLMPFVPSFEFMAADGNARGWLESVCGRLNDLMGEPLLVSDWNDVNCQAAMQSLGKWNVHKHAHYCGGDILGHMLELMRPGMAKGALGAYYTPWGVCYMMAKINDVAPGARVMDPACGSGRMLLAAIQVCRENHPSEPLPDCYGQDVDAAAIKACRLNLSLAGYYAERAIRGMGEDDETEKTAVTEKAPVPVEETVRDKQPRRIEQLHLDLGEAA